MCVGTIDRPPLGVDTIDRPPLRVLVQLTDRPYVCCTIDRPPLRVLVHN